MPYAPQSPDMISWIKKCISDMNKYGKNPDKIYITLYFTGDSGIHQTSWVHFFNDNPGTYM
jgi:hypothetical protein